MLERFQNLEEYLHFEKYSDTTQGADRQSISESEVDKKDSAQNVQEEYARIDKELLMLWQFYANVHGV